MRLHTDLITQDMLNTALVVTGLKKKGVWLEVCEPHGSRSHRRAFEVQLGAEQRPGRRWKNSGGYGSGPNSGVAVYAATYDEWGVFIAEVFRLDAYAKFGPYADRVDFHRQTKNFYLTDDGLPDPFSLPSREACRV